MIEKTTNKLFEDEFGRNSLISHLVILHCRNVDFRYIDYSIRNRKSLEDVVTLIRKNSSDFSREVYNVYPYKLSIEEDTFDEFKQKHNNLSQQQEYFDKAVEIMGLY